MNKVAIVGRLVRDPEVRYSQGQQAIAVTRFCIAANRRFKREGEPDADFINCVCFGKTAEFIGKYFSKGKMIGVAGSIRTSSWTDNTGQKRYTTEVAVDEAEFVESKASTDAYVNNSNNSNNINNNPNNSNNPYQGNFAPQNTGGEFGEFNENKDFSNSNKNKDDGFYDIETGVEEDDLPF